MSTESYDSFTGKVGNYGLQVYCWLLAEVEHHHEDPVQAIQLPDIHKHVAVIPDVAHPASIQGQLIIAQRGQRSVQTQRWVGQGALDLQQAAPIGSAPSTAGRRYSSLLTSTQAAENMPIRMPCWQLSLFKSVCKFHWKNLLFLLHFLGTCGVADREFVKHNSSPALTRWLPPTASFQYCGFRRKPQPFKACHWILFIESSLLQSQGLFHVLYFCYLRFFFSALNFGQHCRSAKSAWFIALPMLELVYVKFLLQRQCFL